MNHLETFVARGQAAQAAVDAIIAMTPIVTSTHLRAMEIYSARRAMRTWALAYRGTHGRAGRCSALFKAVQWRERARALEREAR